VKTAKIIENRSLEDYLSVHDKSISSEIHRLKNIFYKLGIEDNIQTPIDALSKEEVEKRIDEAKFFDDNLIWADFAKIEEIKLIDYYLCSRYSLEKIFD